MIKLCKFPFLKILIILFNKTSILLSFDKFYYRKISKNNFIDSFHNYNCAKDFLFFSISISLNFLLNGFPIVVRGSVFMNST